MSGIAGIISNRLNLENRAELDTMVRCLVHEAFHESGTFVSDEVGVAIGWVSHAGLFSDGMPVWNEERNICFILVKCIETYFSSELYRELETRRQDIKDFAAKKYSWTTVSEITQSVYKKLLAQR